MPDVALVALGSNLGDRDAHLSAARAAIAALPATRLLAASALEETQPLGALPQGAYLNQVLAVETSLSPDALLEALLSIERVRGRVRGERWGPRTLDCDIVAYGDVVRDHPTLRLPHPGLADRDFWRRGVAAVRRAMGAH